MSGSCNNKNDLRARFTESVLEQHLLMLLKEKPLEKITVKELCMVAGINRTTFYTHYSDIFDLMRQIKEMMISDVIRHVTSHMRASQDDKRASLVEYLRYMKSNSQLYLILVEEFGPDSLRQRAWDAAKRCYLNACGRDDRASDFREELMLIYRTYGMTAVIEKWLRDNEPINEYELVDMLQELA
jgi:AcrR family transcriptional regulator